MGFAESISTCMGKDELKILIDDHVFECSDESLNIESDFHLGPNSPRKVPSWDIIVAPSNFPHSQEFTSAIIGKDIKTVSKNNRFISNLFGFFFKFHICLDGWR